MNERHWVDSAGVEWTLSERLRTRHGEDHDWVVLIATSAAESRVARCRRDLWLAPEPDFTAIMKDSVPAGASRGR